jgi:beta-N-acetylhexosaminidase
MLMTAHVLYPALDPHLPATLSPQIIEGLLRNRLHFQGVVVTDDLEMGAIVRHFTIESAAVAALRAGADLLLICHSVERALAARDACVRAVQDGTLAPERVEQARQRIAALKKARLGQQPAQTTIGAPQHQRLVAEILRHAS